ncbi:MAG: antibiotic biosynthesis monooxygenase [Acidimicrobiia bacterium]|nr:antibiotic biosynthesis monooxygenase [Acidimicrobiia bacterium]
MYGLIGKLRTVEGGAQRLASIMCGIGEMPGCVSYVVALDPDDPDVVWVTEVWESADAHAASLELESVQSAIAEGGPLITGFELRQQTVPQGGFGLT